MRRRPRSACVTLDSRGQITLPAALCQAAGWTPGDRFDIYPNGSDEFVAVRRRPSRILDFAGDLAPLDGEGASRG